MSSGARDAPGKSKNLDDPTDAPQAASIDSILSQTSRPHLRRAGARSSDTHTTAAQPSPSGTVASGSSISTRSEGGKTIVTPDASGSDHPMAGNAAATERYDEDELARLKAAVNKRLLSEQRRASQSSKSSLSSRGAGNTTPSPGVGPAAGRNGSPMVQDSPKLSTADTTPSSGHASSTESSKTVRGLPTPSIVPAARTPSYPFPLVAGSPRVWTPAFHQPFTVLSPTTSAEPNSTPGDSTLSATSTPGPAFSPFIPAGAHASSNDDHLYPNPNLYDAVLQLNAEPGLEAWWTAVTKLLHDSYLADRVSLALPADSNDIENVPWGQKATFNVSGQEEPTANTQDRYKQPSAPAPEPVRVPKPHVLQARPGLESRHSYSGAGMVQKTQPAKIGANAKPAEAAVRPVMPPRALTHAPSLLRNVSNFSNASSGLLDPSRHASLSDPDFSSLGGDDRSFIPQSSVFPVLRGLDSEVDGLLDVSGVNKVLERGGLVTLTRDYTQEFDPITPLARVQENDPDKFSRRKSLGLAKGSLPFRSIYGGNETAAPRRGSAFEEYEQQPPSPWSQSPAPSPAVQADPEENPFFAGDSVEDTFNPSAASPHDYSNLHAIEAIGVDKASTVIHLPLIHPTMSGILPSLGDNGQPQSVQTSPDPQKGTSGPASRFERRAPLAIISILSPAVPFPPNLNHSLKMLGPHFASSFFMAHQFTALQMQISTKSHRRGLSGKAGGPTPLALHSTNIDHLMRGSYDDHLNSASGSITSPSDYSGRSRHSPGSSIAGTPGWEHSMNPPRSVVATPAGDMYGDQGEGYFERRRTHSMRSTSFTGGPSPLPTPSKSSNKSSSQSSKSSRKTDEERNVTSEKSPLRPLNTRDESSARLLDTMSPRRAGFRNSGTADPDNADRLHSVLHSYGADFSSSFQSLPSSTMPKTPSKAYADHGRVPSVSETSDMPPPSERLLRTIIDSLPVQIFTAAPGTGDITWVNSKFLVYRGQDSRQVLDEPWETIHPDDRSAYMEQWKKSLRTGQQLQQKIRLQRFDGAYRWFYVRAAPLKDKRQSIVHWIGTNMDFHEQHLAELNSSRQMETAASEAKYRALANSSPQVVFTVNRTKGITFCNTQWTIYAGQTASQALGLGFMEHVHPEDIVKCKLPEFHEGTSIATNVPTSVPSSGRPSHAPSRDSSSGSSDTEKIATSPLQSPSSTALPQRKLSELATTGILKVTRDAEGKASYSTEVRLKSKEGVYRWYLVRVLLAGPELRIHDDEETWYGTCTDIDDHKTLERDLKEAMDEKSRFTSNMSHEIRTPLNGITGMVNFLIDSNLTEEQMEHVNIIRASTEGLRGLINDILDLSKAEAGMIQLSMEWFHVSAMIEEVNDLTSAMAIDKGLELNYIVESDVPSQIKADRFRIRQILLNVVGNAIKFTAKGEVFVRCSVAPPELLAPDGDMLVQFEVIDTGQGFTDKEAQFLFKRFSQIDGSSTRQHGGTGLGLVISRQLAQLHGGDMSAQGYPGKGATFKFSIKTSLPTTKDFPPPTPATPGIPVSATTPSVSKALPVVPRYVPSPLTGSVLQASPLSTETGAPGAQPMTSLSKMSPSPSTASETSVHTARTSLRSERSSASSYMVDDSLPVGEVISLVMPGSAKSSRGDSGDSYRSDLRQKSLQASLKAPGTPIYSILVVCPLKYSREATVQHIDMILPKNIPHQITARGSLIECQRLIGGDEAVVFSHVVLILQDVSEITAFMDQLLTSEAHSRTQLIVITEVNQRRKIMEAAPAHNYEKLADQRSLRFVFKPLKPSKFGLIFDPQKEREMSTDRNQDSAHAIATTQKQIYDELTRKLGNKGKRVLLVEDNKVNQMVLLKFMSKVSIPVDTVSDGVQCIERYLSKPSGYYSIILCDLQMPHKDGYQTCKEIRKHEKQQQLAYMPVIALSANVLGDVFAKCVESGFNSYVTKPVDFKELSQVMLKFLDPADPDRPIEFMRGKKKP